MACDPKHLRLVSLLPLIRISVANGAGNPFLSFHLRSSAAMPQNSPTNKVHEELEQLIADADDLNDTEPPAPTMSGEKRLSPYNDDDDDNNEDDDGDKDRSTLGDEGNRPDDKIEAGLE